MQKGAQAKPEVLAESTAEGKMPMWTPSQLIRHRETGQALLVLHVYRNCTIVAPINSNAMLIVPLVLLEREYHYFTRDTDEENTDPVNYEGEWKYHPVKM